MHNISSLNHALTTFFLYGKVSNVVAFPYKCLLITVAALFLWPQPLIFVPMINILGSFPPHKVFKGDWREKIHQHELADHSFFKHHNSPSVSLSASCLNLFALPTEGRNFQPSSAVLRTRPPACKRECHRKVCRAYAWVVPVHCQHLLRKEMELIASCMPTAQLPCNLLSV